MNISLFVSFFLFCIYRYHWFPYQLASWFWGINVVIAHVKGHRWVKHFPLLAFHLRNALNKPEKKKQKEKTVNGNVNPIIDTANSVDQDP